MYISTLIKILVLFRLSVIVKKRRLCFLINKLLIIENEIGIRKEWVK